MFSNSSSSTLEVRGVSFTHTALRSWPQFTITLNYICGNNLLLLVYAASSLLFESRDSVLFQMRNSAPYCNFAGLPENAINGGETLTYSHQDIFRMLITLMVEDFLLLVNVEGSFPCTKWTRNITDRPWVCPWPWLIQWIILQKRLSWTSISFYAGPSWFTLICCMLVDQDCHAFHQQQKLWSTSLVSMIFNSLTKGGFLVKKQCLSIQVFGLFLNLQCNKQPNLVMFNIMLKKCNLHMLFMLECIQYVHNMCGFVLVSFSCGSALDVLSLRKGMSLCFVVNFGLVIFSWMLLGLLKDLMVIRDCRVLLIQTMQFSCVYLSSTSAPQEGKQKPN